MQFKQKYGPWAIIAGAAEGLGESWSVALAKLGINLIMVDHQYDKLHTLSENLQINYYIETRTIHLDLSDVNAYTHIMDRVGEHDCRLMIYNAAYSLIKPFISHTVEELDSYIEINARTQVKLVHAFSNYLIHRNTGGGIILMSSLAGLMGMQLVAPYAATKAYSWNLAEAIHHELKPHNIDVMACIAGATSTPAYIKTKPKYGILKPQVMKPNDVVENALRKLGKKALYIPGFSNRLNYFILTRLLPRKFASGIANKTIKKMYS
jgi:short-subunit dehydrogenase